MDSIPSTATPFVQPKQLYMLHFDIAHGCQLRCVGCPNSTLLPKIKRISVEDFRTCLGNIDVEHIHTMRLFNFGEPLLHKHLAEIISVIPQQRWKVSIVEISTNAQLVNWADFENALKLEVVNRLVVSCDGDGTPEEYERLRTPSKWSHLLEFLDRARELRDRWSPALQLVTKPLCAVLRTRSVERYLGAAWLDTGVSRMDGVARIIAEHDWPRLGRAIGAVRFHGRTQGIHHPSLAW